MAMLHRDHLRRHADQKMTVSLNSDDASARFDVVARGILDSRQLSSAGGVRQWTGTLPAAAENTIEVHASDATSRYTLEVCIH